MTSTPNPSASTPAQAESSIIGSQSEIRLASFIAKTGMAWQVWKETQPDLFWFLEHNFGVINVDLKQTGEEKVFLVEIEIPNDQVGKLEKSFKDGSLAVEIDKVHGLDPLAALGKKDSKLSRFTVTMGPTRPQNIVVKRTVEGLEEQLLRLELIERTRSIDLKMVMDQLQTCQLDFHKRFEHLEKKVEETAARLDQKCDRLDKALNRLRK